MRLFVALNLPTSVRRAVWDAAAPLRTRGFPFSWVRPEAIHVTVKFLGEVGAEALPSVRAAVGRAITGARRLVLAVGGFGVFPNLTEPRVVWAGLEPDPALELLHHEAERTFEPLGFPLDGRPFRPHLTLGRATRSARRRDFDGIEGALDALHYEATVEVTSVELMESTPGPDGVAYHVRHSERLP